jgi:hypothetical protein
MLLSSEAVPFARTSSSDEAARRGAARFGNVRRDAAWRGVRAAWPRNARHLMM